ncbi:hypothetical protein [Longimicrobium terrae]|uniref:Uncharacterized protein n=1 Tax=Longimicrobium terrae TaxID=1639882 RepID=A0A841H7B7_9BACT|nr:hypothetical protein [Longimicrobium terrae]MBB4639506.1 hypothetical protein [Longimicrobium terrae]MBB6073878.1 hypothetical protein [Longimicrobium terrae]NNC32504.1 hypothetical protein [Longimicrobium terrae]
MKLRKLLLAAAVLFCASSLSACGGESPTHAAPAEASLECGIIGSGMGKACS